MMSSVYFPSHEGKTSCHWKGKRPPPRENASQEVTKPVLVKLAMTLNQAKAHLTFVYAIAEKTLSSTESVRTSARGRG